MKFGLQNLGSNNIKNGQLTTVDGQLLMNLDCQDLTVQISMIWMMLMVHYFWSTLGNPLC